MSSIQIGERDGVREGVRVREGIRVREDVLEGMGLREDALEGVREGTSVYVGDARKLRFSNNDMTFGSGVGIGKFKPGSGTFA